jgi:TIR domain-containing protein
MSRPKTEIFLSYRRSLSNWVARAVYQVLREKDYDVFMDVESIDSGEFLPVILHQIEARPHFLVVLTPGSLERTVNEGDWLHREIEHALHCKRNVVPLMAQGFTFEAEEKKLPQKELPGKLNQLKQYNGINIHDHYFEAGMQKLANRFLKERVTAPIAPTPVAERPVVQRMMANATKAQSDPSSGFWFWVTDKVLEAPTLGLSDLARAELLRDLPGRRWKWTSPVGAAGYVLQKSVEASFAKPVELYNGEKTEFWELPLKSAPSSLSSSLSGTKMYYRVKAKAGLGFLDSPWSNVVEVGPPPKMALSAP